MRFLSAIAKSGNVMDEYAVPATVRMLSPSFSAETDHVVIVRNGHENVIKQSEYHAGAIALIQSMTALLYSTSHHIPLRGRLEVFIMLSFTRK
jgi:hypothetical protein